MKSIFFTLLLIVSFQSSGQNSWINITQEDQAEKAIDEGNFPLAIQLYEKALEIRKAKFTQGFHCNINALKEVSEAMDHLIVAHKNAGNYAKHIELCEELSSWLKEGMKFFPEKPSPYLEFGLAQIKIAESYQALGQYDKGVNVCQNLIETFLNPENNRPFKFVAKQIVPFAHSRAGEILKDQGSTKASVIQHEKSVAAWLTTLNDIKDVMVYEEIAQQSEICVQRFGKLKDSTNVIKYAEIAIKHYEILTNIDPGNEEYTNEVKNAGNTLAIYKSAWGEYEKAIMYYKKSLAINEKQYDQSRSADNLKQMAALNLKLSQCYESLNNASKSAQHLSTRIEQLKQLQNLNLPSDYTYAISRNQYDLAKKHETLASYAQALALLEESITWGLKTIEIDPENIRIKEWQWVQEFFRYQLLIQMEEYKLAHGSTDRLITIFAGLEELEPGIQYSEHIKAMEISKSELAYPDVVKLVAETQNMEEGKLKFENLTTLVKLLKKKKRKDKSMQLSYVRHTTNLAWTGLLTGEFKKSKRFLKKAMKKKPVDPYLVTNYAPCLLFLGKYKKAERVYKGYYDAPFKPGQKIIYGFMDDFEKFEEKGIIPKEHREKVDEIKAKLKSWKEEE